MLNKNIQPNILVIGDLMIDHYLWGKCDRISQEAPVQVVDIQKETTVLGGAGNVINNLKSLGVNVTVLSVVGNDTVANELKQMLNDVGTVSFLFEEENRKTTKKSRIMASHSQVVRYDNESRLDISVESQQKLLEKFKVEIDNFDVILFSDYGKGVFTNSLTKDLLSIANERNKKVLVDPKGDDYSKYGGAFLLTPNKKEAELATNIKIEDEESLKNALKKLKKVASLDISLITLSEDGIAVLHDKKVTKKPTVARAVFDVTGAGDTVLASLGYSLSLGYDIYKSMKFANLAAGVVVGKLGSATVTLDEIEEYKTSLNKSTIETSIKTISEIEKISTRLKSQGKSIVFTNGCFDILHKGHVSYLDVAKSFGDVLILGLNSDLSVKKLKGENRPINNQDDRAYILSALKSVDYVVIFGEETPYDLIKKVQPDTLVKGGDYEGKVVVGSDIAKEVRLVDFVDGKSTTQTIGKIRGISND